MLFVSWRVFAALRVESIGGAVSRKDAEIRKERELSKTEARVTVRENHANS